MGVRVEFHWLVSRTPEAALVDNLDAFRAWCEESATAPAPYDDPDAMDILPLLDRIAALGESVLVPTSRREAIEVDAAADLFFGSFCDLQGGARVTRPASDTFLNHRYYARLEGGLSDRTAAAWAHLTDGRPLRSEDREWPYMPADPVFRFGYWRTAELPWIERALRTELPGGRGSETEAPVIAVMESIAVARSRGSDLFITVA